MKHIFYVHSHITFLVSKQYILDKGINFNDCLFLCSRDYLPQFSYQQLFKNIKRYPQDVLKKNEDDLSLLKNLFNGFQGIHVVENFINSYCSKETFIFYTYSTYSHFCSIIVTMSNCDGYYIIEEGSSAYTNNTIILNHIGKKNLLYQSILVHFFPRFYLLKNHHFSSSSEKYKGTITTSEKALCQLKGEHVIISNPFNKEKLPYSPTTILSIDASLYMCKIDSEQIEYIMDIIRQFILKLTQNPIIAYKMHPIIVKNSFADPMRDILSKTFKGVQMKELSSDIAIEEVLNEYHCDFFSDWSSVAIYANQMGCKCYSYAQRLSKISNNETYTLMMNNMNEVLKEVYVQL